MPYVFLICAGLVAGYGVVFAANPIAQARGASRDEELICMLLAGVLGVVHWLWVRRVRRMPRLGGGLDWMVLAFPLYALWQAIPLPVELVRVLSPARARLADAMGVAGWPQDWVPLSVTPDASVFHALLFTACAVMFTLIYDLASRMDERVWATALPLVLLATFEAALGLAQMAANPEGYATGTFSIRNHYAGMLEMVLPLAVMYPFSALGRGSSREKDELRPYLLACLAWGAGALMMAGTLLSLSRMGFLAMLGSMVFVAVAALMRGQRWRRNALVVGAVLTTALAIFVLLPPARLILRFDDINKEGGDEGRAIVWRASLPLIAEYPLFGCGLGGYNSAFPAFKTSGATLAQDYAHNDYVQYAAELGVVGFVLFGWPIAVVFGRLSRAWREGPRDARWLALACAGSGLAIGVHSFADFNLYVPANLFVFAWILGIAACLGRPQRRREP